MVEKSALAPTTGEVLLSLGGLLAVAAWMVLVVVYLRSDLSGWRASALALLALAPLVGPVVALVLLLALRPRTLRTPDGDVA